MATGYLKCMMMVAAFHHFPQTVLPAMQRVEGGVSGSVSTNKNGTQDLGMMQVNTRWIYPLMQMTHESGTVIYQRLKRDSCYNIAVAAAILKLYQIEAKGNLIQAIGNYHSHTVSLGKQYRFKVIRSIYSQHKMLQNIVVKKSSFPDAGLLSARSGRGHLNNKY